MNSRSLLYMLVCVSITSAFSIEKSNAVEVYSLTKKNRGLFGYKEVDWINSSFGYIGTCVDPGFSNCKPPGGAWHHDPVTNEAIDELFTFADDKIASGVLSGSHTILIRVEGESQYRQ